jgi:hypothetical protein
MSQPRIPNGYPPEWFPRATRAKQARERKALLDQLQGFDNDQLARAVETIKAGQDQQGGTQQ